MSEKRVLSVHAMMLLILLTSGCDHSPETTTTTSTTVVEIPTLTWMIGLGGGSEESQFDVQQAIVDEINASQTRFRLEIEVVESELAYTTLASRIASGDSPDIIGPLGRDGANTFTEHYLDLRPLMEASELDTSVWPSTLLASSQELDGSIYGLPFAVYPSLLYYNRELFDEASLPYPPGEFGALYGEGTPWEGTWDWEKLSEIAEVLTIDSNGNNATRSSFRKAQTVQWGFVWQWTGRPFQQGSYWGAASPLTQLGEIEIPETWIDEWSWYHDAIWKHGFAPNEEQLYSLDPSGNAFATGKVAMAVSHLWYVCCVLDESGAGREFFDVAALPSHQGEITANIHTDTFYILKYTDHPEETFEALLQLINNDSTTKNLLNVYGAHPALSDLATDFYDYLDRVFGHDVRWELAQEAVSYADAPSHESWIPEWEEYKTLMSELGLAMIADPDLDVADAARQIEEDLNAMLQGETGPDSERPQ